MTASTYLALLFGTYIVAVSIPMIWNQTRLVRMMHDFINSPPLIFLTGVIVLMGGISIIAFHNIWVADWRSLITLFGWAATIEGVLMIAAPSPLVHFAKFMLKKSSLIRVMGFAYLALGMFFLSRVII